VHTQLDIYFFILFFYYFTYNQEDVCFFCFFFPHEISYFASKILCNLGQWAMHPGMLKKNKQKKHNKQNKTMVMSLYFSHILKSVNHEWFIYFFRTDLECFQTSF
jgi:hypothetical protein